MISTISELRIKTVSETFTVKGCCALMRSLTHIRGENKNQTVSSIQQLHYKKPPDPQNKTKWKNNTHQEKLEQEERMETWPWWLGITLQHYSNNSTCLCPTKCHQRNYLLLTNRFISKAIIKRKKVKLPECTSAHGISNPEPHLGHKAESEELLGQRWKGSEDLPETWAQLKRICHWEHNDA